MAFLSVVLGSGEVLTLLLLNAAAAAVALLVVRAEGSDKRVSLICLIGLSTYLLVVHTAMLAAGLAGRLTVGGVSVALAICSSTSTPPCTLPPWAATRCRSPSARSPG